MLIIGIDQWSLTLRSNLDGSFDDWINWEATYIISEFMKKSRMLELFKEYEFSYADCKLPEGYSHGYSFRSSPWYFCIAFNEGFRNMGVIVKLSAWAWAEYKKRYALAYGFETELHNFLRSTMSDKYYSQRLSRVDPFVDFINEGICVAKIKRSIEQGRLQVHYGRYQKDTLE